MITGDPFKDFEDWRNTARNYLMKGVMPESGVWENSLLSPDIMTFGTNATPGRSLSVPAAFLEKARTISRHTSPKRWMLLYAALYRLVKDERHLFDLAADPLVRQLSLMEKSVRRDAHKAKAFVRFKKALDDNQEEHFFAWHQSDHDILPLVAPFFGRRFEITKWTIMSPQRCVTWDGKLLSYTVGIQKADIREPLDKMEDLWRAYYRATFNPARISINAMTREMPRRYWPTMPETSIIKELINEAPSCVKAMIDPPKT